MQRSNFTSVPFNTETSHGLKTINGVAKFSTAGIVLEFEGKLFGIITEGVKEVRLPLAEILDIRFKKGIMGYLAKIEIRTASMLTLSKLPSQDGKLILKIKKNDITRAQSAVERVQKDLTQFEGSLPPPHTPVSELFLGDDDEPTTKNLS